MLSNQGLETIKDRINLLFEINLIIENVVKKVHSLTNKALSLDSGLWVR